MYLFRQNIGKSSDKRMCINMSSHYDDATCSINIAQSFDEYLNYSTCDICFWVNICKDLKAVDSV